MQVIIFYSVNFAIAVFNLWRFLSMKNQQSNIYYPIIFSLMAISNSGFWALSIAETVEAAAIANHLSYLGGCFLLTCTFFCVLDLCSIRISSGLRATLVGISIALYGLILSAGRTGWYYATMDITRENGFTQIVRTKGPFYSLYSIHTLLYVAATVAVAIYAIKCKKNVSYKNLRYLLTMLIVTTSFYFSKKVLGYDFNLVPLGYAVDGFILLRLHDRLALYDVSATVAQALTKQDLYGYVTFDNKRAFLACDHMATHFFPELNELHVDHTLSDNTVFFKHLHEWMSELDETGQNIPHYEICGDNEIKCTASYIQQEFHNGNRNVGYMIEFFDVTDERKYMKLMASYNEKLQNDVARETAHVKDIQNKMILGMANMIENRDNSTGGHVKRTSKCVEILVDELKSRDTEIYTNQFCDALIKAAPMHDIGKIAVPDAILQKPGKFTPEEFAQMKNHAAKGAELLTTIIENVEDEYFVTIAKNMAHYHHERWNGTGYPSQLKGEEIPLEARVMAVADVYDALVSKRCYKDKFSFEEAANIIRDGFGSQFDPGLTDVFEQCREKLETYYQENE